MAAPSRPVTGIARALTIAGSDPGGGAGIQADLKVFFALGCYGMSAVTAVTAQNTEGVSGVFDVGADFVAAQIDAVVTDIGVDAAKTGMLATRAIVEAVAASLERHRIEHLVVDPVLASGHGDELLAPDAFEALRTELLPLAEVVTPNLDEAAALTGMEAHNVSDMREAAARLLALGPRAVLVTGGHLLGDRATDVLVDGDGTIELDGPRHETSDTHGTGCALSAAIAARLAHGDSLRDAAAYAKEFVAGAIEHSLRLGSGTGPINLAWRSSK